MGGGHVGGDLQYSLVGPCVVWVVCVCVCVCVCMCVSVCAHMRPLVSVCVCVCVLWDWCVWCVWRVWGLGCVCGWVVCVFLCGVCGGMVVGWVCGGWVGVHAYVCERVCMSVSVSVCVGCVCVLVGRQTGCSDDGYY